MNMQFLCQDGLGYTVDEDRDKSIDLFFYVVEELFAIEASSSLTQSLINIPPERASMPVVRPAVKARNSKDIDIELCNKRGSTTYSNEDETRFFLIISQ